MEFQILWNGGLRVRSLGWCRAGYAGGKKRWYHPGHNLFQMFTQSRYKSLTSIVRNTKKQLLTALLCYYFQVCLYL